MQNDQLDLPVILPEKNCKIMSLAGIDEEAFSTSRMSEDEFEQK